MYVKFLDGDLSLTVQCDEVTHRRIHYCYTGSEIRRIKHQVPVDAQAVNIPFHDSGEKLCDLLSCGGSARIFGEITDDLAVHTQISVVEVSCRVHLNGSMDIERFVVRHAQVYIMNDAGKTIEVIST